MSTTLGYFDPQADANAWGLPHITDPEQLPAYDAWLVVRDDRLYLQLGHESELPPLSLDYTTGRMAHRLKQLKHSKLPLAKACGLSKGRRPAIIDATAGFGQDALSLAALGSKVVMLEQQPLVYVLVADALKRARNSQQAWLTSILTQVEHKHGNSCDFLAEHSADVIYLDPMYPERDKANTAKVKKGMQILRNLPGCATDTEALFGAAMAAATQRVVVKRPVWAEKLGKVEPNIVVSMPNHNFDVYLR